MHAQRPVFHSSHVQQSTFEVNLIPSERTQFRRPESVAVPNKDHRRVAVPLASAIARGVHQKPHVTRAGVLSGPVECG
jgi:hypothetical protein